MHIRRSGRGSVRSEGRGGASALPNPHTESHQSILMENGHGCRKTPPWGGRHQRADRMTRAPGSKADQVQSAPQPKRPSIWAILLLVGSMGFFVAMIMLVFNA